MPKTLFATISVPLSGDEFTRAEEMLRVKPLWDTLVAGLGETAHTKLEILETAAPRARGPRKPKPPDRGAIHSFADAAAE